MGKQEPSRRVSTADQRPAPRGLCPGKGTASHPRHSHNLSVSTPRLPPAPQSPPHHSSEFRNPHSASARAQNTDTSACGGPQTLLWSPFPHSGPRTKLQGSPQLSQQHSAPLYQSTKRRHCDHLPLTCGEKGSLGPALAGPWALCRQVHWPASRFPNLGRETELEEEGRSTPVPDGFPEAPSALISCSGCHPGWGFSAEYKQPQKLGRGGVASSYFGDGPQGPQTRGLGRSGSGGWGQRQVRVNTSRAAVPQADSGGRLLP